MIHGIERIDNFCMRFDKKKNTYGHNLNLYNI